MACGNPFPDGRADLLRVLRQRHLAGADRPDRLIGDRQHTDLLGGEPCQPGVKLPDAVRKMRPRLPDSQRLPDRQHWLHLVLQYGLDLGVHQRIVFVVKLPPLRVPGQYITAPELGQHPPADVTGVGAVLMWRDVLRPVLQLELVTLDERLHAAQGGEWREHDDVNRREVLVGQPERELLGERERFQVVVVHLPVADDQRLACPAPAHWSSSSAASPGSVLPSRNSRLAPPPVEMWLKALSGKSSCRTAAAESPPPTTVSPATSLIALATAQVPAAKAANSNTPTGPFQKTVLASAGFAANSARVRGPMSRLSLSAGNASAAYTSCAASGANAVAPTRSTGRTN